MSIVTLASVCVCHTNVANITQSWISEQMDPLNNVSVLVFCVCIPLDDVKQWLTLQNPKIRKYTHTEHTN